MLFFCQFLRSNGCCYVATNFLILLTNEICDWLVNCWFFDVNCWFFDTFRTTEYRVRCILSTKERRNCYSLKGNCAQVEMSKENVPVSSQHSVTAPASGHGASQHSVTAPMSEHNTGASQQSVTIPMSEHSEHASEHSMIKETMEPEEEESQHSTAVPSFEHPEHVPSLESISSPYNTKDKDFVNAKAFLLEVSTVTGLNLWVLYIHSFILTKITETGNFLLVSLMFFCACSEISNRSRLNK